MWRTASVLVGVTLILTTLGIIMLASTSSIHALQQTGNPYFYVKRQMVALIMALVVGVVAARIDYSIWRKMAIPLALVSMVLLVLALTPGIGVRVGGSNRWVRVGPINFQPSELGKMAVIVLMSWYMSRSQRHVRKLVQGLLVPLLLLGLIVGLIFAAPDFGTTMLVGVVGMALMYAGGTRISYLIVTAILGLSAFMLAVLHSPVRMRRVTAFLDPHKYELDEAYQLLNAIYAFVVGGGFGVGLGESLQKRFYLPESHTDFIFAIIGEELGLVASLSVLALFATFFIAGMRVVLKTRDLFGKLLALGVTLMISFQAVFNVAVVTGAVPTKGLPLPFISYGGSSILISVLMVGVLVNIAMSEED
jgi:cell division protein FtsW